MKWDDIARSVVFGQGAMVFLLSIGIIVRYAMLLYQSPSGTARALPIHIFLVSLSYNLATIFIVMEIWQRIGQIATYRTPLAFIIFALGDFSLVFMLAHLVIQRQLLKKIRDTVIERESEKSLQARKPD